MNKMSEECKLCPGQPNYGKCPACLQCEVYNESEEKKEYKEYLRLREKFGEYEEYKRLQAKYGNIGQEEK